MLQKIILNFSTCSNNLKSKYFIFIKVKNMKSEDKNIITYKNNYHHIYILYNKIKKLFINPNKYYNITKKICETFKKIYIIYIVICYYKY